MQQIDTAILLLVNSFHTPFLDHFWWNYSQALTWLPLYLMVIALVICRWRTQGVKQIACVIIALGLCVGLADFISSSILKPIVERPRPTHAPELEGILHIVNGYRGGRFGFCSSHAANSFGLAMLFCLLTGKRELPTSILLFVWAFLNSLSRIYLGAHYPGDILGGTVVGLTVATCIYLIVKRFYPALISRDRPATPWYITYGACIVWVGTVLCIMIP